MVSIRVSLALLAASYTVAQSVAGDTSVIAHTGEPVGKEMEYGNVTLYVSESKAKKDTAVLYLTDVFGIQLRENKLLADSFARAGFLTVAPDLFSGNPAPADLNAPGWNIQQFLADNGPDTVDPRIAAAVKYLKTEAKVAKIAVTGYCFGGRFAFRTGAAGKGADVVFAAHPSNLGDAEIKGVEGPASIAAAETDSSLDATRRGAIEGLLKEANVPYQLTLYGGTSHGFGVRANISDPEQKFGKESAFLQAVRWFESWA